MPKANDRPFRLRTRLEGRTSHYLLADRALDRVPELVGAAPAAVLLDAAVNRRHGERLHAALRDARGRPLSWRVRPGGERAKCLGELENTYRWLARIGLPRDGVLVGVGGGALLDLAGLAAATWLRGVQFISVPTTLLAMVDAAIGGKTAINVAGIKNNVGAFHPATHVVADPSFLSTLPTRQWRCGMAEMIKAAMIGDPRLFAALEQRASDLERYLGQGSSRGSPPDGITGLPWPSWIARAARVKARLVTRDFRESGPRRALNLGHTLGHALEAAGGVSHGEAVAIGMAAAATLAARRGLCRDEDVTRLTQLLSACGLPTTARLPSRARLSRLIAGDKKRRGDNVRWVLPAGLGSVLLDQTVDLQELAVALRELSTPARAVPPRRFTHAPNRR